MDLWQTLKKSNKPIVLYGMGNGADRILDILESLGISVQGVFASDDFVRHQLFRGFTVCSYQELKERFGEMVVLVAFGTQRPEVIKNIKRIALEQELYVPDVPVVGNTLFDEAFVKAHKNEFSKVYELLGDQWSKTVYEKMIRSKLSGNISLLFECESEPSESFELLNLSENEIFLDLGAYNGDTVEQFLQVTKNRFERILTLEPDNRNFKKLIQNTGHVPGIQHIHACIGEQSGELHFEMDGGRKSKALDRGGIGVPCTTVDEILKGGRVSYIKMDVEGAEFKAILGGRKSIEDWKPKMLVSAYHRSEDLFELPLLVHSICPEYRIFIRHFPYVPGWDTNFYFKL